VVQRARLWIGLLAILLAAPLAAEDLPPAPKGFAWKKIDSVKAAFLVPRGWFFKEESKDGTRAFFITQEDIDKSDRFETGLTVNVQTLKTDKAPEYAAAFIAMTAKQYELMGDAWQTESGVLKGFGCRVRKVEKGFPPLIMHELAIGNSRTNALYLLIFESPEPKWKDAWSKGEQILRQFFLDDEI
jgi:hypothetical protein